MESDSSSNSVRRSCRKRKPKYCNVKYHYTAGGYQLDHVEHKTVDMINMNQSIALFGRAKPSPKIAKLHGIKYYKKFDAEGDRKIEKLYDFDSESDDEIALRMKTVTAKKMSDSSSEQKGNGSKLKRIKHIATKSKLDKETSADVIRKNSRMRPRNSIRKNVHAKDSCSSQSNIQDLGAFEGNTIHCRQNLTQNEETSFHRNICPRPLSPFSMAGLSEREIIEQTQCISSDKENVLQKALNELGPYEPIDVDDFAVIYIPTVGNTVVDSGLIVLITDNRRPFKDIDTEFLELTLIWGEAKVSKKLDSRTVTENLRKHVTVRLERGTVWSVRAVHSRGCIIESNCSVN